MTVNSRYTIRLSKPAEVGEERWISFISASNGSVYHHPAWHRVIGRTYGIRPVYFIAAGPDGSIRAGMPAGLLKGLLRGERIVSYPFSDVCGPVCAAGEEAAGFIEALLRQYRDYESVEIRAGEECSALSKREAGYVNFEIRLEGSAEKLFSAFHPDCVRRQVRKAFKAGLDAYECSSLRDFRDFYGLHLKTRKRQGAPVQPFTFFRNIFEVLCPSALASLILVKKNAVAVSGVLMLRFGDRAYYKFGATDERHFSSGAAQLALWTAIKKASDEGYAFFDLGRTFTGNKGLMDFKSRWAAQARPLYYLRWPEQRRALKDEGAPAVRVASALIKALPVFSNRLLGRLLYRYLA
ncbi:MAG TPA: GNAT family N-acetyltransferase [Thermodesulfobacteriota bacterium]